MLVLLGRLSSNLMLQHLAENPDQALALGDWQVDPEILGDCTRRRGGVGRLDIQYLPLEKTIGSLGFWQLCQPIAKILQFPL
ncbi:MAG: hypothetical protein F6K28_53245 [Microcoleus sp. SIO2G3]|nr:hypothetical protein [Microcoleus sp. SIO2G3]